MGGGSRRRSTVEQNIIIIIDISGWGLLSEGRMEGGTRRKGLGGRGAGQGEDERAEAGGGGGVGGGWVASLSIGGGCQGSPQIESLPRVGAQKYLYNYIYIYNMVQYLHDNP